MRLWREMAAFSALLHSLGGTAKVYRRGWARDGSREVESLKLIGCYKCLLSRRGNTLTGGEPAAMNQSTGRLYLPAGADIRPGDRVEVSQNGADESFYAAGQPERYPVYLAAELRKEEVC